MTVQLPIHNPLNSFLSTDDSVDTGEPLRVGDVAKLTGKTVRALHLYEELGLLEPTDRSKGGYRLYDARALSRVRWIGKLQDMGFSLTDIRDMVRDLEEAQSAPMAMKRVNTLFEERLRATREQLRRLRDLEHELEASLAYLTTCDTCNDVRLLEACTSCGLHASHQKAPELVAGFQSPGMSTG